MSATWQFKNIRTGQWIDMPRKISVTLEKSQGTTFGGKPCIIELQDVEYKVDFQQNKAFDTRNYHRSIDIQRVDQYEAQQRLEQPQRHHPVPESPRQSLAPLQQPSPAYATPPVRPSQVPRPAPQQTQSTYVPPPPANRQIHPDADGSAPPSCRVYYMPTSLNCVGIQVLLKEGNVAHDLVEVDVTQGQNQTAQFRALNPTAQIPVLEDDDGTVVWESNAILRYICNTFSLDDHFYPTNNAERARLEMALDWRQTALYPHLASVAGPVLGFSEDFAGARAARPEVERDLRLLATFWLKDRPFICGGKPSIADLSIVTALLLLEATDIEIPPVVQTFTSRMSQEFDSWDYVIAPFLHLIDSLPR